MSSGKGGFALFYVRHRRLVRAAAVLLRLPRLLLLVAAWFADQQFA